MGNLCGKQSADNFNGPGRVVGAAPTPQTNAKASLPPQATARKIGGPARTLGGADANANNDAGSAAAAAAERRNNQSPTGDLAKKLAAQKKQTMNQTLQAVAAENRAHRGADTATETRNYN